MMYDEGANLMGAIHNAHKTGIREEQERIIKLLEDSDSACSDWAIALIKGEI